MRLHQPALITLAALFVVTAWSDRAADRQRAEEAVARGEAPAAAASEPAPDAAVSACARLGGQWNTGADHCTVTLGACAGTGAGSWVEGTGCVTDGIASEGECTGFGGMRWNGSQCVLAYLDRTDINNIGL